MNKLKIYFVNYGLGRYYTYNEKDGTQTPVIEVNEEMAKYDMDLFVWVFQHEIEHYKHRGKNHSYTKEVARLLGNPKMFMKLNKFETKVATNPYGKEFAYKGKENK